jgi:hypothetical protein
MKADLRAALDIHRPHTCEIEHLSVRCEVCGLDSPCYTARALAEIDRLEAVVDRLVHHTPFIPATGGITAFLSFEQMDESRIALEDQR